MGARSLAELRALPAEQLLAAPESARFGSFPICVDGHALPRPPAAIFAAGEQARVPLLAGWNSEEAGPDALLGREAPTPAALARAARAHYGELADEVLRLYPAASDDEAYQAAADLASDRWMGYSTWKWCEVHRATSGQPVFRYFYAHPRPPMRPAMAGAVAGLAGGVVTGPEAEALRRPPARGAVHSADIEYAMGTLDTNEVYAWSADDAAVSELMQAYYVNFVRSGDPNGPGLPAWPPAAGDSVPVMRLAVAARAEPEAGRARYLLHDRRG
jgi:para-nitrobenzyl esterase